jgi:two-component system, OmpR family, phosphate regulon sensor histidine kinase PhoR
LSLRLRLLFLSLAILAGALTLVGVGLRSYVEGPRIEGERERIVRSWNAAARLLLAEPELLANPAAAAPELGRLFGLRVTLVDLEGVVLGDSGVPDGDVRNMESHASRPEIQAALEGRIEVLERRSPTSGVPTLYAAGPVRPEGTEPLLLRVATPLSAARGPLDRAPALLLILGLLATLGLGGGSGLLFRRHRQAVETMERKLRALSRGEGLPSEGDDGVPEELEGLAQTLARTADELTTGRARVTQERDDLLTLVDTFAEGVLALDQEARVLRCNRAAGELLEMANPAPLTPVAALVRHPELRDHLEASVTRASESREFQVGPRWLRVTTAVLPGGGAVATLLDVTGVRRMEAIRRDFVANASHELKTPLTAIRGFAETLLEGDPPELLRQQFLGSIRTNTLRMQSLVDDLLDLSRLESGSWTVKLEPLEVGGVARGVWALLMEGRATPAPGFEVEGAGVALADRQALEPIFRNLMDNALRYTPPTGEIRVRIEPGAGPLMVSVSDSGAGIPSAALPRIFERFYRVDAGRDRGAGGTGLGLAIVRHLVQSMGGEVSAESVLGEGTTIRFTLPRGSTP